MRNGIAAISNRIFETRLYNYFLTTDEVISDNIYQSALQNKSQFVKDGHLNMRMVLERFVVHFHDLYGDRDERFYEDDGRRFFLLYLMPIINGTGNYYIEAETRNRERTDVIADYLDYYHLDVGYMLSFSFNKTKEIGVRDIQEL